MNFRLNRFFNLAISFIIGGFFFIFGAFGIFLPWSTYLQSVITQFILHNTLIISLFGLGFVLSGLSLIIHTLLKTRYRYMQIRTGHFSVALDEKIIYQYIDLYWQKIFPYTQVSFELTLKKNELEIVAELPSLPLIEQKNLLEQIKLDFSDMFGRILGYPHDVHLIASFKEK